jgi:hypothetical protein
MENEDATPPENQTPSPPPEYQKPPKTWLVESILVTLFCCLPFGIVGIVNAAKVESRFHAGQIAESEHASREAGKWTKIGFWIGIACIVIYVLLMILGVAGAVWNESYY